MAIRTHFVEEIRPIERMYELAVILRHSQALDDIILNPISYCSMSRVKVKSVKRQTYVGVALAVSAMMGTPGNFLRNAPSWRYSARKSCPHSCKIGAIH